MVIDQSILFADAFQEQYSLFCLERLSQMNLFLVVWRVGHSLQFLR